MTEDKSKAKLKKEARRSGAEKRQQDAAFWAKWGKVIVIGALIIIVAPIIIAIIFSMNGDDANIAIAPAEDYAMTDYNPGFAEPLPDSHVGVPEAREIVQRLLGEYATEENGAICSTGVQIICFSGGINAIQFAPFEAGGRARLSDGEITQVQISLPEEGVEVGSVEFTRHIEAYFVKEVYWHVQLFANYCPGGITPQECGVMLDVAAAVYAAGQSGYGQELDLQYLHYPSVSAGSYFVSFRFLLHENCQALSLVLLEYEAPGRNWGSLNTDTAWESSCANTGATNVFRLSWNDTGACEALAAHWRESGGELSCPIR